MIDWLLTSVLGGSMRMVEALMSAGPTLLVGLMVAAILRFYLGTSGTRQLFGGSTYRSLPQSWAVGMLLPVCSIGVLPILLEMRRAGMKAGAMSAFALSAPLFNPLSLLYGVTLSRPYVILMFALGSLFVVTVVGIVWDRFSIRRTVSSAEDDSEESDRVNRVIGIRRIGASIIYTSRQFFGPVGAWAVAAGLGVALLASSLPTGALGNAMDLDDWWAPARMATVAIPAYATPMMAMGQLGMMFQHANSPGAAFILLVIGAGVNLGTIAWMSRQFGFISVSVWFGCLLTVVIAIAYTINRPLAPPGVNPSSHTHAFDIYTNPIERSDSQSRALVLRKLKEKFGLVEMICVSIFAGIGLLGAVFRVTRVDEVSLSSRSDQDDVASTEDVPGESLGLDRIIGPQVVGGTLIAGLIAVSIVMCYAFYPSPDECIKEIQLIRADALTGAISGDVESAKFWIPRWDQWSRRMEVGAFLRRGHVTPYQRMQGFLLRKKLDLLEHELDHDHDDPQDMRDIVHDISQTDARLAMAYRQPYEGSGIDVDWEGIPASSDVDVNHEHHGHVTHDHEHNDLGEGAPAPSRTLTSTSEGSARRSRDQLGTKVAGTRWASSPTGSHSRSRRDAGCLSVDREVRCPASG